MTVATTTEAQAQSLPQSSGGTHQRGLWTAFFGESPLVGFFVARGEMDPTSYLSNTAATYYFSSDSPYTSEMSLFASLIETRPHIAKLHISRNKAAFSVLL